MFKIKAYTDGQTNRIEKSVYAYEMCLCKISIYEFSTLLENDKKNLLDVPTTSKIQTTLNKYLYALIHTLKSKNTAY